MYFFISYLIYFIDIGLFVKNTKKNANLLVSRYKI